MDATGQRLAELLRDVLRPLIEADEGKLYLVSAADGQLALHLGGVCAGCPGASLTVQTLIEPAVYAMDPATRVKVTFGTKPPENALLIRATSSRSEIQSRCGGSRAGVRRARR